MGQAESLEGFLGEWPGSRWAAALSHNLGPSKYDTGFFTAAKELEEIVGIGPRFEGSPDACSGSPVGRTTGQDARAAWQGSKN